MKVPTNRHPQGSVLVVCLVIVAVGALGVAAILPLVGARSQESEVREESLTRRLTEQNSRALAREAFTQNHLASKELPAGPETFSFADDMGEASFSPHANSPLSESNFVRLNLTGAVPSSAFSTDVEVILSSGPGEPHTYQLQAKSHHPIYQGNLLSIYRHPDAATYPVVLRGDLTVEGRLTLGDTIYATNPDNGSGIVARRLQIGDRGIEKLALSNPEGGLLLPENYGPISMPSGKSGGVADLSGQLHAFDNPESPENSYLPRILTYPDHLVVSGAVPVNLFAGAEGDHSSAGASLAPPPGAPFDPATSSLLCQAYEAHRLLLSAAFAANSLSTTVNFSFADMSFGSPEFSTWWNDARAFDGTNPSGVATSLNDGIGQLQSSLISAMSASGGPDPTTGGWWPPAFPDFSDTNFWSTNNPYLGSGGTAVGWETAMVGSDGEGSVQIDLGDPSLTHVLINSNVRRLILTGQTTAAEIAAAESAPPIVVVVDAQVSGGATGSLESLLGCSRFLGGSGESYLLEEIELRGENHRRHILAIRKSDPENPVTLTFSGPGNFPEWHALWELESCPLSLDLAPVVEATMSGSIRTDTSFEIATGALTLEMETELGNLTPFVARNAWLEIFKHP